MLILTLVLYDLFLSFVLFAQEAEVADFNDLGKMLLGGFALAVLVAVSFVFVKMRLRDKKPSTAEFLSINTVPERNESEGKLSS